MILKVAQDLDQSILVEYLHQLIVDLELHHHHHFLELMIMVKY